MGARCRIASLVLICASAVVLDAEARTVTLNLQDADIGALISTVSAATKRNFVIDPRVKGKVTVISGRPLEEDVLYQVFLSVLKVNGFAAVPAGEIIKIVPNAVGKVDSIPTASAEEPGTGDQLVTRVISIQHVSAAQLAPILRPLVPQDGHLAAYPAGNTMIISDTAANVERLAKIIQRVDVPEEAEIEVIRLKHASAGEVVRILTNLQQPIGKEVSLGQPKIVADDRTNSLLISAARSARLRLRAVIVHLDTPLEGAGNAQVIYLRYARAAELVPILEALSRRTQVAPAPGRGGAGAGLGDGDPIIQADEATNSVIIDASPAMITALGTVIRQLDIRRAQVYIESAIAEISSDKAAELGIQWRATTDPQDKGVFGGTNFAITGNGINQVATNPQGVGSGLSLGFVDGLATFAGEEFLNIGALVRALEADSDTNVLSTPTLVTLDNEEAEIVVAENVPFITGQFTDTGAAGSAVTPFQTVEREDVGIILRVKPQINEGNALQLDIEQEISQVVPSASPSSAQSLGAVDLITQKRSIKTSVLVDDGKMLVLGGLIDDVSRESVEKVPFLGDLPLLGRLFRYDSTSTRKRNLMVFLRPAILLEDNADTISNAKYSQFRGDQLARRERAVKLLPKEKRPLLPPLTAIVERLPEVETPTEPLDAGDEAGENEDFEWPSYLDGG